MSVPYLAQAADHEQLEWLGGGVMRILLDGKKTDGQLTMIRSAASAGSASPVHVHASEDEIIVLVKGSGIFWAGEHRYELSDGGVAFLPRGVPHAYRFTSDTVDMLAVCPPPRVPRSSSARPAGTCPAPGPTTGQSPPPPWPPPRPPPVRPSSGRPSPPTR